MFQIFKNNFKNNFYIIIMIQIEYILLTLFILLICYFIFFKKETFINKKLENFDGDDLNVHYGEDLNTNKDVVE